jgi:hypothetical protein
MQNTINIFQVIKNRSKIITPNGNLLYLYPNCIDSIINSISKSNFRYKLYVYDFNSDDYPLENWLPDKLAGKLDYEIIRSSSDFFDKGEGLNFSRQIFHKDDFIFYLDADILITELLVKRLEYRFQAKDSVGFFSTYFLNEKGEIYGNKVLEGTGILWIKHCDLIKMPPWISMDCWGGEDTVFLYNCLKSGLKVARETDIDLYHQWHPTDLRNKYYKGGKPPKDDYSQAIRDYYKTGVLREITK